MQITQDCGANIMAHLNIMFALGGHFVVVNMHYLQSGKSEFYSSSKTAVCGWGDPLGYWSAWRPACKTQAQAGQKGQGRTKTKPDNSSNSKGKAAFKKLSLKDFESTVNILKPMSRERSEK